jgi:Flp pilus assembly protein TadD
MRRRILCLTIALGLPLLAACNREATPPPSAEEAARLVEQGLEHHRAGRNQEAVDLWKKIPQDSPQWPLAQNNLGSAYIILREFDKAEQALTAAINAQPDNALFRNNMNWLQQERAKAQQP